MCVRLRRADLAQPAAASDRDGCVGVGSLLPRRLFTAAARGAAQRRASRIGWARGRVAAANCCPALLAMSRARNRQPTRLPQTAPAPCCASPHSDAMHGVLPPALRTASLRRPWPHCGLARPACDVTDDCCLTLRTVGRPRRPRRGGARQPHALTLEGGPPRRCDGCGYRCGGGRVSQLEASNRYGRPIVE